MAQLPNELCSPKLKNPFSPPVSSMRMPLEFIITRPHLTTVTYFNRPIRLRPGCGEMVKDIDNLKKL